ncbi:hypothetical protein ILYODFUR_004050 [Ilyodon furcidens]|uniref:Uncharacterized protein n=1 Tax=Ilyodon furcidens TaxID=33524 RepID=A0ABV0U3U4_9TELE
MGRRRGTPRTDTQTTKHTLIHTPKGNLERPINQARLDSGRKPEYPEGTHACAGRTCKLHAKRPPAGSQTQDLLQGNSATSCATVQPSTVGTNGKVALQWCRTYMRAVRQS